ncbi:hypothetical protein ACH5RR_024146 [Cinchona calisaya]|uniref:Uncharacterized protein n=1 Tax=Cinchona calisaya TaxID=153742 RepID=A0ABD2ZCP6_9GENT
MRSGILYNVSLPGNYSGIDVSILRIRIASLWHNGANVSFFDIPPRILPNPISTRLNFVYQNLGNLSDFYYNVPSYTFITPVMGLLAYDANSRIKSNGMVELRSLRDHPILVHFPEISSSRVGKNSMDMTTMKCVRFGTNGEVEFGNVTTTNKCIAQGQGHFSIVIPSQPPQSPIPKRKDRKWKWWVIGFGVGIGGLVLYVVCGILLYKFIRKKRIAKMERQSEKSEALGTIWVGSSRMPLATGIRTQPILENSDVS